MLEGIFRQAAEYIEPQNVKEIRKDLESAGNIAKMISVTTLICSVSLVVFAIMLLNPATSINLGLNGAFLCILSIDGIRAGSKAQEIAADTANFQMLYLRYQNNKEDPVDLRDFLKKILEPTYILRGVHSLFCLSTR